MDPLEQALLELYSFNKLSNLSNSCAVYYCLIL